MDDNTTVDNALRNIHAAALCLQALTAQMLCPQTSQYINRITAQDMLHTMALCERQISDAITTALAAL